MLHCSHKIYITHSTDSGEIFKPILNLLSVLPWIRSMSHTRQRLSLLQHFFFSDGTFFHFILPFFVFLFLLVFIHLYKDGKYQHAKQKEADLKRHIDYIIMSYR